MIQSFRCKAGSQFTQTIEMVDQNGDPVNILHIGKRRKQTSLQSVMKRLQNVMQFGLKFKLKKLNKWKQ